MIVLVLKRLSEKTLATIVGEVKGSVRMKLVLTKQSSGNVCDCNDCTSQVFTVDND